MPSFITQITIADETPFCSLLGNFLPSSCRKRNCFSLEILSRSRMSKSNLHNPVGTKVCKFQSGGFKLVTLAPQSRCGQFGKDPDELWFGFEDLTGNMRISAVRPRRSVPKHEPPQRLSGPSAALLWGCMQITINNPQWKNTAHVHLRNHPERVGGGVI